MLGVEIRFAMGVRRYGKIPLPYVKFKINHDSDNYLFDNFTAEAEEFTELFRIAQRFKYSSGQLDLFETYFAGYFALKSNSELNYLTRRPEFEIIRNWPLVGRLYSFLYKLRLEQDETGSFYLDLAARQSSLMRENPHQSFFSLLKNLYSDRAEKDLIEEFGVGDNENLCEEVGLPYGIQNAANNLSAIWNNPDKLQREALELKVKSVINNIALIT